MTRVLTVVFSALMLAGCADGYDKAAVANVCKRQDTGIYYPFMSSWSMGNLGADVPSKNPGNEDGAGCLHKEDSKAAKPQTIDLQKTG